MIYTKVGPDLYHILLRGIKIWYSHATPIAFRVGEGEALVMSVNAVGSASTRVHIESMHLLHARTNVAGGEFVSLLQNAMETTIDAPIIATTGADPPVEVEYESPSEPTPTRPAEPDQADPTRPPATGEPYMKLKKLGSYFYCVETQDIEVWFRDQKVIAFSGHGHYKIIKESRHSETSSSYRTEARIMRSEWGLDDSFTLTYTPADRFDQLFAELRLPAGASVPIPVPVAGAPTADPGRDILTALSHLTAYAEDHNEANLSAGCVYCGGTHDTAWEGIIHNEDCVLLAAGIAVADAQPAA